VALPFKPGRAVGGLSVNLEAEFQTVDAAHMIGGLDQDQGAPRFNPKK
jgi:hypothetical protein